MIRRCSICGRTECILPFKHGFICRLCQEELRTISLPISREEEKAARGSADTSRTGHPHRTDITMN